MQSLNLRYEIFDFLIKKINENDSKINCLEKSSGNIFELFYYDTYKYRLRNLNIFLLKVIGEKSLMGTIYLSKYNNYKFITKIILLNNFSIKELEITEKLSNIAYQNKNIHLPLLYGHSLCNKINVDLKLIDDKKYNPKNSYYCLFIELYEGSMYILLLKILKLYSHKNFVNYIYNIIIQCFISILSCHINNIYHNDPHINNFLYSFSNLSVSKYSYKYLINSDLEFNVEPFPYIITICDFGLSNFKNDDMDFRKDYKKFLDSMNKYYINKYDLNDKINLDLMYDLLNKSENDYDLFKKLKENRYFSNKDDKKIEIVINLV